MRGTAELSLPCPPLNACAKEPDNPPQCGYSYDYLSPLLLAEELCPGALTVAIKAEQSRPEDKNDRHPEAGHNFRLGSLFLDLSNAWGVQDSSSRKFSGRAFELLNAAAESEDYSRARVLSSFLCIYESAFPYRWADTVPGKVLDKVSEGLVGMAKSLEQLGTTGAANSEHFSTSLMLLYATYDELAFPSTARESLDLRGMTDTQSYLPVAHQIYTIEDGGKMPHRNKFRRRGRNARDTNHIVSMRFSQLAKHAFDDVERPSALDEQGAGKVALGWLCEKAEGATLSPDQEECLFGIISRLGEQRRLWHSNWKKPADYRPEQNTV